MAWDASVNEIEKPGGKRCRVFQRKKRNRIKAGAIGRERTNQPIESTSALWPGLLSLLGDDQV
ncbi:MAG: hypothetical protein ACRD36_07480, partial [Candidatus Acidiferrum sp.]